MFRKQKSKAQHENTVSIRIHKDTMDGITTIARERRWTYSVVVDELLIAYRMLYSPEEVKDAETPVT